MRQCDTMFMLGTVHNVMGKHNNLHAFWRKKFLSRDEKVSHWFPSFDTGLLIVYPQSSIINYQLPITLLVNFHVHHLHHDQNDPGHDGRMLCSEKLLWALWSGLHAHHWLETLVFSDEDHNDKLIKISDHWSWSCHDWSSIIEMMVIRFACSWCDW